VFYLVTPGLFIESRHKTPIRSRSGKCEYILDIYRHIGGYGAPRQQRRCGMQAMVRTSAAATDEVNPFAALK
jgi:hypothetical protein